MTPLKELIEKKDYDGINKLLEKNPRLANEGLPYDEKNTARAHPLHRLCDAVCSNMLTEDEAIQMAEILLRHGAHVNGNEVVTKKDTPLIAAASLSADKVGLFYIDNGANIHHAGSHGGTALHWAAWCGRDVLVNRLIREKADINKRCIDFTGTPLLWAVHGFRFGGGQNRHHQVECVRLLLEAGADKTVPNIEGVPAIGFLDEEIEMIRLLS